jgi:TFIIF-interacting CTD phosphatase-like protein
MFEIRERRSKSLTDKCLVLDLDETLVHTQTDFDYELFEEIIFSDPKFYHLRSRCYKITMDDVVHKKGTGDKTEMWGICRPYLQDFLKDCFKYFKLVIIWSAGRKNYVHRIVDYIFRDLPRPDYIFTYDDLEKLPDNTFIKPLSKIWKIAPEMTPDNSLIVDDRKEVFEPNKDNGIQIKKYHPVFTLEGLQEDDSELIKLRNWLFSKEVINCENVRKLDKTKIF